ncbi:MAG: TonB-dependent receptor [Enhygromyxa sp.]
MGPRGWSLALSLALASSEAWAGPPEHSASERPPEHSASEPAVTTISGQLREAGGSRAPISGAAVMIVDAPEDVRPGKPAREPLDPESIAWVRQTETDAEGRFVLDEVPLGKVRVVVVAGGYERLEQWAEAEPEAELRLYVQPEQSGTYRTEVAVERARISEPTHVLDGEQARHYAGGGDDPVLVALNLPGAARTPGGFGLLSLRGGNPNETGVYLDGHPIPRAFHIVPIASVLSPSLTDRVEISPGNYGPGYGSFSAGLVEIYSRAGRRDGIHGETHLDLFDVGTTLEAPVGEGSVHFGVRRSHIDGVLLGAEAVIGDTGILFPSYWDYLGRFDYPLAGGHRLTVRALGAGDRLRARGDGPRPGESPNLFEFNASFHRFDLDYRFDRGDWRVLISPSLRLDSSRIKQDVLVRRDANVFSGRAQAENRIREWISVEFGTDVVYERWRRRERVVAQPGGDIYDQEQVAEDTAYDGEQLRLGVWLATAFRHRGWSVVPSLRGNLFSYAGEQRFRLDPRLDVRGLVHPQVTVFGRLGMFGIPMVLTRGGASSNLISRNGAIFDGIADVPPYLIAFFDPGVEGELREGSAGATHAIHGSTGVEAALPWELDLRGTLFWREVLSTTVPVYFEDGTSSILHSSRRRSAGLELLLRRALGPKLDGWIGYTLMWARQRSVAEFDPQPDWRPAIFDQRHNLVVLLSATLPRGFRFGMRFRVVSGNPESPVLAGEAYTTNQYYAGIGYRPIRGEFGSSYQPLFHQLDLRLDKRWVRDRASVTAYLDVQNVYNRVYPEVPVYTRDWSQRASLVGLPIYLSIGVRVEY